MRSVQIARLPYDTLRRASHKVPSGIVAPACLASQVRLTLNALRVAEALELHFWPNAVSRLPQEEEDQGLARVQL